LEEATLHGSVDLLWQVWLNLLDNAIKFSPQDGEIHVQLSQLDGHICVTIQDSGPGMDEQAQAHCFDKFY